MFSRPFLLQSRNFEPRLRPVGNSAQQIEAQVSTAEWKLGPNFHVLLARGGAA